MWRCVCACMRYVEVCVCMLKVCGGVCVCVHEVCGGVCVHAQGMWRCVCVHAQGMWRCVCACSRYVEVCACVHEVYACGGVMLISLIPRPVFKIKSVFLMLAGGGKKFPPYVNDHVSLYNSCV